MNDLKAHTQWSNRPADERFTSVEDLLADAKASRAASQEREVIWGDAQIGVKGGGVALGVAGKPGGVGLTNWAFRQICGRLNAPANFMAEVSAPLAAEVLMERLSARNEVEGGAKSNALLTTGSGASVVRGFTSDRYTRIWDEEVIERVASMPGNWTLPEAYVTSGGFQGIKTGPDGNALMQPSGAYRGDRDMFLFMVDESARIDDGSSQGLARGFFVWNSEVGAKSFGLKTFLYRYVCGNHIVWGSKTLTDVSLRHVGNADQKAFAELALALGEYAHESASSDEQAIAKARTLLLGKDEEETVAQVVKVTNLSQKAAVASFKLAEKNVDVDGSPVSLWGMTQGITRYAQLSRWTDDRVEVDAAAGQLMVRVLAYN